MEKILTDIKEYHEAMGYKFDNVTDEERIRVIREAGLAAFLEVAEVIESFEWKPWKPTPEGYIQNLLNQQAVCTEIVDVVFFLALIMEAADISIDLFTGMLYHKLKVNKKRLESGYHIKINLKGGDNNEE